MEKIEMEQLFEKGYLRVKVIFEMLGKPKEHIETTLKQYVQKVKATQGFVILSEEFAEAIEQDDSLWSTFAEIEVMVESIEKLTWISVNFMPASIEIMEPTEINASNKKINFWLNDILAKLHEISILTKGVVSKDKIMSKTLGTMMKNIVLIALESGSKTVNELHMKTGIREDQINEVLKFLVDKKRVEQDGESYKKI